MTAEFLPDAALLLHLAKSEPAEGLGSRITLPTEAFGNFRVRRERDGECREPAGEGAAKAPRA
jgi:hypothetical protein